MNVEVHLTTTQLAERLQMSPGTLRNWRQSKPPRGPKWIKLGNGRRAPVRYRLADVLAFEKKAAGATA